MLRAARALSAIRHESKTEPRGAALLATAPPISLEEPLRHSGVATRPEGLGRPASGGFPLPYPARNRPLPVLPNSSTSVRVN